MDMEGGKRLYNQNQGIDWNVSVKSFKNDEAVKKRGQFKMPDFRIAIPSSNWQDGSPTI
jgi:hypothetical protein